MNENKYIDVEIITPQKKIYNGKVISVSVPGSQSPFQILYNHAPIVSSLDTGVITLNDVESGNHFYAITSGFIELSNNKLSVLVENALDSANLNKSEIIENIANYKKETENSDKAEAELLRKKISFAEAQLKAIEKQ